MEILKKAIVKFLIYLKFRNIEITTGKNVKFKSFKSHFSNTKNISFGDNVFIGPGADFDGAGKLIIEDNVIIAPNVTIMTRNHYFDGEDLKSLPFDNRVVLKPVKIKKNTWIGRQVIILPGVTVGEGSIIAAGSVVTKDVEPLSVVGGNPSRLIKKRNEKIYYQLSKKNTFVYNEFGHRKEFVKYNDK